jgi:hypothetical protein
MDNGWDVRGDDEGQEFIFYNSKQEERARFQSIAGIGLKKLIEDKPIIWELLIAARKDIDGLRSFIKKLEELYPGLYKQLRDLQHNEQSFMDGLRLINSYIKK